ncbi:MAG: hypothetical protein OEY59_11560, partial [Deltaproteobacteria bacterium]|nr:hypothetical protein [Deltaproteobacteria bacterium]
SSIILPSGRIHFQTPAFKKGSWAADMPYDETSGGSFYRDHPYWFVNIIRFVFFLFCLIPIIRIRRARSK